MLHYLLDLRTEQGSDKVVSTKKPVSLADLARILGTTPATVSRALRNDPRISLQRKTEVRQMAERMGYALDPETTRLMAHVRARREKTFQSTLGLLTDYEKPEELLLDPYTQRVIAGAKSRAEALGYIMDPINLREPGLTKQRMEGILQARAIHGVLIPPQAHLPEEVVIPEEMVALVAATAARAHLHLHRVFPDHFNNMLHLLGEVTARGYRKIGLITTMEMEERQRHGPLAGYEWFVQDHGLIRIPPLLVERSPITVSEWFRHHQPDVLVGPDSWIMQEIQSVLPKGRKVAVALFGNRRPGFAGMDEQPEAIGAAAIDLLTAQVLRDETGFPQHPKNVLIQGRFHADESLPTRTGKSRKK